MQDREFIDLLYQMWSKTTFAKERYWDFQKSQTNFLFDIRAVGPNTPMVALGLCEHDADWITAVHGVFPDLVDRFHEALDEADRLDREMDEVQDQLAEAYIRIAELEQEIKWTGTVSD